MNEYKQKYQDFIHAKQDYERRADEIVFYVGSKLQLGRVGLREIVFMNETIDLILEEYSSGEYGITGVTLNADMLWRDDWKQVYDKTVEEQRKRKEEQGLKEEQEKQKKRREERHKLFQQLKAEFENDK